MEVLAWLIPVVMETSWLMSAVVIVTFVIAVVMGFSILWSIFRKE